MEQRNKLRVVIARSKTESKHNYYHRNREKNMWQNPYNSYTESKETSSSFS